MFPTGLAAPPCSGRRQSLRSGVVYVPAGAESTSKVEWSGEISASTGLGSEVGIGAGSPPVTGISNSPVLESQPDGHSLKYRRVPSVASPAMSDMLSFATPS